MRDMKTSNIPELLFVSKGDFGLRIGLEYMSIDNSEYNG